MRKIREKITETEKEFIIQNYPLKGAQFCAKYLNSKIETIRSFASRNKIKCLTEFRSTIRKGLRKDISEYKVDANKFLEIRDPISAYILGLIWADGHIKIRGRQHETSFANTYPDANYFLKVFKENGNWNFYNKKRQNIKWKDSCIIYTSNRYLAEFLYQNDYKAKSQASADKILNLIPDNLKNYWFLGLLDGDGSIKSLKGNYSVIFTSSIEQDWSFLIKLCQDLNIKYFHGKTKKEAGKNSRIGIFNRSDALTLLDYLYQNYENDKIGLPRKYEKYISMLKFEKEGRNPRLNVRVR